MGGPGAAPPALLARMGGPERLPRPTLGRVGGPGTGRPD
jgi:hypothetical protein